ncbi:ribbon-helix-helix domain-containing protein [Rubrimonas cliftonensis]|uniref:Predicted DNA-binding protein, contains Ribbon-helix-helix (RHH) domain n=1 Tax=Rubrimonas cliftonensis TaxID=89524 RepID=A0A1H3VM68_9RHOB|nr:ribbon-helix-helix domain-containing protein [Rubrimonas cliftonensis]SDZ75344.1 Predicted DNA-binding protein, contains Ribbon-helix-helix (RHH) domain [Rubrimonas cliftonensis]
MCRIFAGQDPEDYESETRSLRLHGHCTSIRLERAFWAALEDIAAADGLTTPQFIGRLHDEVIEMHGEARNFTSLLRCACLVHLGRMARGPRHKAGAALAAE